MKKVLAFLLTAILAFTALTVAAESPSPEKNTGVITSVTAKDKSGSTIELSVEPTKIQQTVYTKALDDLKKEVGDNNLKIVDQKQLVLKTGENPTFPVTVELKVPGVKPTSKVYILFSPAATQTTGLSGSNTGAKLVTLSVPVNTGRVITLAEANEVVKLDAIAGTNKVTATFNQLGEFVLVTDAKTVSDIEEAGKSHQTSDKATPVVFALFAVAALAAVVSVKKIKTA